MFRFSFLSRALLLLFILMIKIPLLIGSKIYTGTVISPIVENLPAGTDATYYGSIQHVAKRGTLIQPSITDLKGNTVVQGTIIIQQGTKFWKYIVNADKANIFTSKQDLITGTENLKRFKELAPTGAESIQNYQQFQNEYYKYYGAYIQSQGSLLLDEEVLDTRTRIAPFEGYVKNVMYSYGRSAGNPETIEISQLNPIGIKVKMDRINANKINASTPVTVHHPTGNKIQGVYNGFSILCEDGIILLTENKPKQIILNDEIIKKIKYKINDCYPVDYFYIEDSSNKTLCVPKKSIQKDNKGYYVWKAKNRKFLIAGKSFNPVFQVVKEYVSPGNLQRLYAGDIYVRSLNESGKLAFGDAVLNNPPKGINEGDTVALLPKRYEFMPGEKVKIEIGN
jgi:hypothetical protein